MTRVDRRRHDRSCVHIQPNTRTLGKHRGLPHMSDRPSRRPLLGNPRICVSEAPARNPTQVEPVTSYRLSELARPRCRAGSLSELARPLVEERLHPGAGLTGWAGGAVMSGVIRGSGAVCWPAAVPVGLGLDQAAEVGPLEEHAVPLGALAHLPGAECVGWSSGSRNGGRSVPPCRRRYSPVRAVPWPRGDCSRVTQSTPRPDRLAYLDDPRPPLAFAHRGGASTPSSSAWRTR